MAIKDYTTTVDGIETQFGINHVGHFLLTNLLMDTIVAASPGARIVNVSSFRYLSGGVRFDDWNFNVSWRLLFGRETGIAHMTVKDGADYNPWYAYRNQRRPIFSSRMLWQISSRVEGFYHLCLILDVRTATPLWILF